MKRRLTWFPINAEIEWEDLPIASTPETEDLYLVFTCYPFLRGLLLAALNEWQRGRRK